MSTHNLSSGAKKKKVYPCKPQYAIEKWGLRGSSLHGHVFQMHVSSKNFDKQKFKI